MRNAGRFPVCVKSCGREVLKEKINQDFKTAFKEKRETSLSVLKMIKAALLNKEKEKEYQINKQGKDAAEAALSEEEIIDVISVEVKKMRDGLSLFEKGGRADLAAKSKEEIAILMHYLPEQLSEPQVRDLAAKAIAQVAASGIKDMGKVMAVLIPEIKGKTDSGLAGRIVKEMLG